MTDTAVDQNRVVVGYDKLNLPPELFKVAASLKMGIEVSIYGADDVE